MAGAVLADVIVGSIVGVAVIGIITFVIVKNRK